MKIAFRDLTPEQRTLLGLDPREKRDLEATVAPDKVDAVLALLKGAAFTPVILITPAQQDVTPWAPVNGC